MVPTFLISESKTPSIRLVRKWIFTVYIPIVKMSIHTILRIRDRAGYYIIMQKYTSGQNLHDNSNNNGINNLN